MGQSPRKVAMLQHWMDIERGNRVTIAQAKEILPVEQEDHRAQVEQAIRSETHIQARIAVTEVQVENVQATISQHREDIESETPAAAHELKEVREQQDTRCARTLEEIGTTTKANEITVLQEKARLVDIEANLEARKAEAERISRQVAVETTGLEASRQTLVALNPEQCKKDIHELRHRMHFAELRISLIHGHIARTDMLNAEVVQMRDALAAELVRLQRETALKVAALDEQYAAIVESNKAKLAAAKAQTAACVARLEQTRARIAASQKARDLDLRQRRDKLAKQALRNESYRAQIKATKANRQLVEEEIAELLEKTRKLEARIPRLHEQTDYYEAYLATPSWKILENERMRSTSPGTPDLSYSRSPSSSPQPAPSTPVDNDWL
ncbi:hypothetical protein K474DRAFT_1014638 [Panus rudis PR-1116 ss-1]|nr:hypothetical protein K474DRAFT_1014638 [Panus rudis PR-1116 ss-1]